MEDRIQESLNEVIGKEIKELENLEAGSKEKSEAARVVAELYKLRLEEAKIHQEKVEKRQDAEMRQKQMRNQLIEKAIDFGKDVSLAVGGWAVYSVWQRRQQIFELQGTVTSPMFRNLLGGMLPKLIKK